VNSLLAQVLDQPPWLVYVIVGLVVFLEDAVFVGFVVPGETVAASLVNTELGWTILLVVVAAIVGDSVGYEIGRIWGTRILAHRFLDRYRKRLDGAQDFLRRRGGSAVFLGRWTAFFRAVMPALAGSARMPYRTFLPWNAVGGLAWGVTAVLAGYFAGMSYEKVAKWLGEGAAIIVAAIVLLAILAHHLRKRRAERAA
jgi:membrane-associated protein